MANIQATLVTEPELAHQERGSELRQFFSYLYLLRFSLALWLSLPGLLLLNYSLPSLAHGIFALERPSHFFYAGFFVTIAGCVALVNARITCAYGEQRFGIEPPKALAVTHDMRWRTFLLSQVPGFVVLFAICAISIYEASTLQVAEDGIALLAGIATALAIWILISTFYYWTHRQPEGVAQHWASQRRSDAGRFLFAHRLSYPWRTEAVFSSQTSQGTIASLCSDLQHALHL